MTVQDLKVHLAEVVKNKGTIHLYEKIVHVDFGDCLLLLQTFLHSDCYGSRGNLCVHGIVSLFKWNGRNLGKFDNVLESKFGGKYKEMNVVPVLPFLLKIYVNYVSKRFLGKVDLYIIKIVKLLIYINLVIRVQKQVSTYYIIYVFIFIITNCIYY